MRSVMRQAQQGGPIRRTKATLALSSANALGLTISETLLATADEVIQ
jgi:hypothetical protein